MGCTQSSSKDANGVDTIDKNKSGSGMNSRNPSVDESKLEDLSEACFGAGCYWGTEKYFRDLAADIFVDGKVGFMGPDGSDGVTFPAYENPTYEQVCTGRSGHVEVFNFKYKGGDEAYKQLCRIFYQFHDPTTVNRQGNDKGPQYASVIYCYTPEQLEIANNVKDELQKLVDNGQVTYINKSVTTDIRTSTTFYPAHEEHQRYLMVNPNGYCNHRIRFSNWP